ncbi:MAG: hypothetical protein KJ023_00160 [Burkholderiaceae bacterium]|nr:hypothetical protein [Burkholderiaceae bacterium]
MIATAGLAPPVRMPGAPRNRPVAGRSHRGRHPRVTRAVRGALSLILYVALAGGVATAVGSALAYWRGHAAGAEQAEQQAAAERADAERRHRAEQDRLRADAQAKFDAALVAAAERYDRIDTARKEAQHALAIEQSRTARLRGDLAAAVRDRDRLRDALAGAATGGVTEAEDSTAACRARADALGRVLGEALSAHRQCSLDAEDLAAGLRALRGWAGAVEASERAGEVAP